jgi:hypothetical protein
VSNFAFGIVDSPENFENIKKALENPDFIDLMRYARITENNRYDRKVIGCFRKDFWKEVV